MTHQIIHSTFIFTLLYLGILVTLASELKDKKKIRLGGSTFDMRLGLENLFFSRCPYFTRSGSLLWVSRGGRGATLRHSSNQCNSLVHRLLGRYVLRQRVPSLATGVIAAQRNLAIEQIDVLTGRIQWIWMCYGWFEVSHGSTHRRLLLMMQWFLYNREERRKE